MSLEFHMTHGQRGLDGIWIGKILRMMKFDAVTGGGGRAGTIVVQRGCAFSFGGLSGIPD